MFCQDRQILKLSLIFSVQRCLKRHHLHEHQICNLHIQYQKSRDTTLIPHIKILQMKNIVFLQWATFPVANIFSFSFCYIRGPHCSRLSLHPFRKNMDTFCCCYQIYNAEIFYPVAAVWRVMLMGSSWWMEYPLAAAIQVPHGPVSSTTWQTTVLTTITISWQRSSISGWRGAERPCWITTQLLWDPLVLQHCLFGCLR